MRDETEYCDLCYLDGEARKKAVAHYRDGTGKTWAVCKTHRGVVNEAGLSCWPIEEVDDGSE